MKSSKFAKGNNHGARLREIIEQNATLGVAIKLQKRSVERYLDEVMLRRDIRLAQEGMRAYK